MIEEQIRLKLDTPNILYNYVERKRLNQRRADFVRLKANDVEFPRYTEEEVILLVLGAKPYSGMSLKRYKKTLSKFFLSQFTLNF